jgi:hypothetical protein
MNELHRLTLTATDMITFERFGPALGRHVQASGWAITSLIFLEQTPVRLISFANYLASPDLQLLARSPISKSCVLLGYENAGTIKCRTS